jgi:hypothetical protein
MDWLTVRPYVVGYGFAIAGGHVFIWILMRTLWKSLGDTITNEGNKPYREQHKQFPMMLGILERGLYAASWQFGKPEFIAVWLALKVAGQWKAWGEDREVRNSIVSGRAVFNVFLIGNGLSIGYGVVGALMVDWLGKGLSFPLKMVPLILVTITLVFSIWARLSRPRFFSN